MAEQQLDFPLNEVADKAAAVIKVGATVLQKFTCDKCGSRQTMDQPNTFFLRGSCEECGYVTDIEAKGCNYVIIFPV
jgi:hypothetical protein